MFSSFLTRAYICITMSHEAKKGPISRVDCSLVTTVCGIPDASMHIMPVLLQMHGDHNCDVCMWHASNYSAKDTRLFVFTAQGLAVRSY